MAETYTSNLELVKPDYDSPADIFVINSNMDKIDNAVANAGKVKSVNGKTGEVNLTASDVSALPSDGTAVNSNALNGNSADKFAQIDLEESEDAGDILHTNADLLGGMTLEQLDIYFEKLRLEREHPVGGQPYITFLPAEQDDPNVKWPWTSWTLDNEASGRFLLGANGTYPAGSTGGEAMHKLTIDELPDMNGTIKMHGAGTGGASVAGVTGVFTDGATETGYNTGENKDGATSVSNIVFNVGGDQPHNNMPPYLSVYMWKRTA